MKTIIISDIHGNLEALNKALEYIDNLKEPKRIICLGDIVGYGPNPVECLKTVLSLTDKICLGNHDYAILNTDLDSQMVWHAVDAIKWTRNVMDEEMKEATRDFQLQIEENNVLYVHASPVGPMKWDYISNKKEAASSISKMDCSLCFVGHSHVPGIYADYALKRKEEKTILSKKGKTIVNVGSIGQSRDRSTLLSFAVFDDVNWDIEIVRLPYDYHETIAKIERTTLPPFQGERLIVGM